MVCSEVNFCVSDINVESFEEEKNVYSDRIDELTASPSEDGNGEIFHGCLKATPILKVLPSSH